jgi:nucleotide-binding universal stress UspA family protein
MERILLAVDGSEHASRAAKLAGELSGCMGAPVVVVHVVPAGLFTMTQSVPPEYVKIEHVYLTQRELLEAAGQTLVDQAASAVRAAGGTVQSGQVLVGNAAQEIVAMAEAEDCDCIILGRRGLGNVGGLLMGSVSHKVGQLTDKTLITTE